MEEAIIIPMEDAPMHTPDRPVCEDDTCPYHEDEGSSGSDVHLIGELLENSHNSPFGHC